MKIVVADPTQAQNKLLGNTVCTKNTHFWKLGIMGMTKSGKGITIFTVCGENQSVMGFPSILKCCLDPALCCFAASPQWRNNAFFLRNHFFLFVSINSKQIWISLRGQGIFVYIYINVYIYLCVYIYMYKMTTFIFVCLYSLKT